MSVPNINLKTLDFNSIKTELIEYISSKNEFADYNFEGSALSSIIDLLAYNSFYQIIFQNILVNEMFLDTAQKLESIISHAKIQGYLVPGKVSSDVTLRVRGSVAGETIPAYTRFQGIKTNGDVKLFYNVNQVTLAASEPDLIPEAIVDVYEAKRLVRSARFTLDVDTQSVFIPDVDMDQRTLQVRVSTDGTNFVEYRIGSLNEPNITQESNVCFLERRLTGYDVVFSGQYNPITGQLISNPLEDTAIIELSYLVSSGLVGNGASTFSIVSSIITNPTIVSLSGISSRGRDEPNIESLKFSIPRQFSAQDRVVTKDDVKAFLVENGFAANISDIAVEGGDERTPQVLGKVYFKRISSDLSAEQQTTAISLLTEKGIAGIQFEYDTTLGT